MGGLFDAALSAHYHTAYLRGDQGLHTLYADATQRGVDHTRWRAVVDTHGTSGPILSRILKPKDAMVALNDHHANGALPAEDHRSRHAIGAWIKYNWHCRNRYGRGDPDVEQGLNGLLGRARAATGTRPAGAQRLVDSLPGLLNLPAGPNPDAAQTAILQGLHATQVGKFTLIESTVDHGVTKVQAELVHEEPNPPFDKIARYNDPRAWSQNFPELWPASYLVKSPQACIDRFATPDPFVTTPIGEKFTGYLYEKVAIELLGVPMMAGTNLLNVTFNVDPDKKEITLAYRLHECLTSSVLCFLSAGGADVDSAEKNTDPERTNAISVRIEGNTVTTRAAKHVRFANEAHFAGELNAIALPMWKLAIVAGLYRALSV